MPCDLLTYNALAFELNFLLKGGKVQKITQPEKDEVRFVIYNNATFTLVASSNPSAPRLHIANDKKDNPYTAPAFCMLLRKRLLGSIVDSVEIFNNDRIFKLSFIGKNEMQDDTIYYLYCELMGRYSNLILCDEDGKIIDCTTRVGFERESKRLIVPNVIYVPPNKSNKAELFETDKIISVIKLESDNNPVKVLMKNVNGLSKQSATEIAFRAGFNYPYDDTKISKLIETIQYFNGLCYSKTSHFCTNADLSDFFITPYLSLADETEYRYFPTLNGAVNAHYVLCDKQIRKDIHTKDILNATRRHKEKLIKKISYAQEKLTECENMESIRISAELLTANIYRIKRGDTTITVENYYDNMAPVTIPLDITKSPQQNAAYLFNKFNKLKRAQSVTQTQLIKYQKELVYVESILEELSRAALSDVSDIKEELVGLGIIKKQTLKHGEKQIKKSPPRFYEKCGHKIYVGTNNALNNEVTFKIGRSFDVWLHVKNHHGSHVIIQKNSEIDIISEEILLSAAQTAAYFSSASASDNVAVDYTDRKYVKRIKDAGLGMVNYENYHTVYVNPINPFEI